MSELHRLRSDQPNPLRFQGGLQHYHVAPQRKGVTWEQWIGERRSGKRRWFWVLGGATAVGIAAVVAALYR